MRSSTWRLEDLRNVILNLGFVGENLHTRQIFDCKKMFDQYPNASVSMTVTPPEGEPYPGTIERDGDMVIWDVRDSDLVADGDGEIQLVFTQEPHIARSYNARTHICRSQVPTGSIPSGLDDYITRADQLLDEVKDTFPVGGTTGQVLAKKSDTDYDTEWVPQGAGGTEDYDELENRPQIGGVTLTGNKTLHDLGAASEGDVDAKYTKPAGGIPASDIADGVIPDPGDLIDDTAGEGDTDKVWSADKSHSLLTEINSKADEPTGTKSAGKVYGLDSNLNPVWTDQQGGGGSVDPQDIAEAVDEWCDENITNPDSPPLDRSLSISSAAAPADIVGVVKERTELTQLLNGWDSVNWTTGYINENGTVDENSTFRNTDFIPVSVGDEISYHLSGFSTIVYIITAYDDQKQRIGAGSLVGETGFKTGTYVVSSGTAFVRLSSGSVSDATFSSDDVIGTNPYSIKLKVLDIDERVGIVEETVAPLATVPHDVSEIKKSYTESPNLLDPTKCTDASAEVAPGYVYSPYMPVEQGKRYTLCSDGAVFELYWSNSSKSVISTVVINNKGFEKVAPSGASFARVSYKSSNVTQIMFAEGVQGDYIPYNTLKENEELPLCIVRDTNNLNDPGKYVFDTYIESGGTISAYQNSRTSDFIPVEEGKIYNAGGEGDKYANLTGAASYDSNMDYIGAVSFPYTVPSGVAYIRVSYTINGTQFAPLCVMEVGVGENGIQMFNAYDTFRIVKTKPSEYEQANSLYGLKWNAMGDSITEGSGTTKPYHSFIKERTGIIPTNYGISDTAIARRSELVANDMSIRYVNMTNDADIITVFGGTNDHGNSIPIGEWGDSTVDTLYGAMKILCEGLISKYMGKKIGFILPLPKYVNSTDYSYPNESFGAYIECIKDVCKRYSIPYLDLYTECGFAPKIEAVRTAMIPDGLHPNAVGHELISWQIQRFLERL